MTLIIKELLSVVLNGEKGKVQYIGFRAVYTAEEYEVKMFEQKTGKLIRLEPLQAV